MGGQIISGATDLGRRIWAASEAWDQLMVRKFPGHFPSKRNLVTSWKVRYTSRVKKKKRKKGLQ